jgi:enterochelin esterase-like enzyme
LQSYLAFNVVDTIDRTFRTIANRTGRAIGGMSSGGYCALNVGLHHLHRFSEILASEPYGTAGMRALQQDLGGNWPLYRANAPAFYIPIWRFTLPVASFLDSGGFDRRTTTDALRLAEQLALRGQPASYRPAPHQHHNWREARAALPYALIFAWQHFGKMRNGGSDAADLAQFVRVLHYAQSLPPPRLVHNLIPPSPALSPTPSPTPTPSRSR